MSQTNPLFEILVWTIETAKEINVEVIKDYCIHAPQYYKAWFLKLLDESPQHILIETGLICFIIWLVFIRKTVDPNQTSKNKLSKKEIEELIDSWQPEPLIPPLDKSAAEVADSMLVVSQIFLILLDIFL